MAAGKITRVYTPRRYSKKNKTATVKQVKSLIARNVDKDEIRTTVAGGTVLVAGAIYNILSSTDITDDAKIKSFKLRFSLTNVTNANQLVRCILFQYKFSSGQSAPTVATVLDTATPLAQYQENVTDAAHILFDRTYAMNLFDRSLINVNIPYVKNMLTFKNNATSGINSNDVWMIVIGTVNTNTTLSSMYALTQYQNI